MQTTSLWLYQLEIIPSRDGPLKGLMGEMCHCVTLKPRCVFISPFGSPLPGTTAWPGSGPLAQSELSHSAQSPTCFSTSRPLQLAGLCLISSDNTHDTICHFTVYYHRHKIFSLKLKDKKNLNKMLCLQTYNILSSVSFVYCV